MEKSGAQQPPASTAGAEAAALQTQVLEAGTKQGDEKAESNENGAKMIEKKPESGLGSYFVSVLLLDSRWVADNGLPARLRIRDET
jgi:hypothetical protein